MYSTMVADTGVGTYVEPRTETKQFYENCKTEVEEDVAKYGKPNSSSSVYYKGEFEVTDDTRRNDQISSAVDSLVTAAVITLTLYSVGYVAASTFATVRNFLSAGASTYALIRPKNTLPNGAYQQFTVFIDTPCVIYGDACTQTIVLDYYWAQIDGAYGKTLLLTDYGVCYH